MNENNKFTVDNPLYVKCSKEISSFPLSFRNWNDIKDQVNSIEINNWAHILGGATIGAGFSAIASLFIIDLAFTIKFLWIIVFIFVSIIGAGIVYIGKNPFSKKEQVLPKDIIKHMDFIEREVKDYNYDIVEKPEQNVFLDNSKVIPQINTGSSVSIIKSQIINDKSSYKKEPLEVKEEKSIPIIESHINHNKDKFIYSDKSILRMDWSSQNKKNKVMGSSIEIMDNGIVWGDSSINDFNIKYNVKVHEQIIKEKGKNPDIRFYIAPEKDGFPRIFTIFPWELSERENSDKFECHINYQENKDSEPIRLRQIPVCKKIPNIVYGIELTFCSPKLIFRSNIFYNEGITVSFDELKEQGFPVYSSKYIGFHSKNSRVTIRDILIREATDRDVEIKKDITLRGNYIEMNSGILANKGANVSAFYIGQYPITNEEYVDFLNALGNEFEGVFGKRPVKKRVRWMGTEKQNISHNWNNAFCGIQGEVEPGTFIVKEGYEHRPVVYITWYGAVAYCNWLSEKNGFQKCYGEIDRRGDVDLSKNGFRLPMQDEWEYACRAKCYKKYYWGEEMNQDYCWYGGKEDGPQPVGLKKPNGFGLYDMIGHIWQWTNSKKDGDYILRGGSFSRSATLEECGSGYSDFQRAPGDQMGDFGFRVVRNKE